MIIEREGIGVGLIDATVILETNNEYTKSLRQEAVALSKAFASDHTDEIEGYLQERVDSVGTNLRAVPWYDHAEKSRYKQNAEVWSGTLARLRRLDEASPNDLAHYLGAVNAIKSDQENERIADQHLVFSFESAHDIVRFFKHSAVVAHLKAQKALKEALDHYPQFDVIQAMDQMEDGETPSFFGDDFHKLEADMGFRAYDFAVRRSEFIDRSIQRERYRGYARAIQVLPLAANVARVEPVELLKESA